MKAPFEKFKVFVSYSNRQDALSQTVFVEAALDRGVDEDLRLFVDEAIREKLQRVEAGKD